MSSLFLSRVEVLPSTPQFAHRGTSREYMIHQSVADLFGDQDERCYLWRELSKYSDVARVLVLSSRPVHSELRDVASPQCQFHIQASKPFLAELRTGQRLDFELRANATRVVSTPASGQAPGAAPRNQKIRRDIWDVRFAAGMDREIAMADVYGDWLQRQLGTVADIGTVAVTERRLITVRRSAKTPPIPIVATNLAGELEVRDPDGLVVLMQNGIGRGRAFGCGLLCLAPLGSRPRRSVDRLPL